MSKAELVFVPAMGMGHLVSTVEIAKLLVDRDDRLFITVLILNLPTTAETKVSGYIKSLEASSSISERIKFVDLPPVNDPQPNSNPIIFFLSTFYENHKPQVRDAVAKLAQSRSGPDSPRLAGFVIDMFCSTMVDVANEFGLPTYVYMTSGAGFLSLMSHLQSLADEQNFDPTEFKNDPKSEFIVPGFVNPVPTKVWPGVVLDKATAPIILGHSRRIRQSKGFLVNTFLELETRPINSCEEKFPPMYPVGPILNLNNDDDHLGPGGADIIKWLDNQPPLSVVFLCFGSMGSLNEDQVKEIAIGVEQSGHRFVWSLRKPPPVGEFGAPADYTDPSEVLPEGFLDRTAEIGKIIGWAPQVAILAHPAIGGFVSHCGWNSTLESIWFGVPIATWPLSAEQQLNAFWMVKELGLAVEIKLDYRKDAKFATRGNSTNVTAQEIESGIKSVMEVNSEIRKRVKQVSEKSRKALVDGGSSYASLGRFLNDVIKKEEISPYAPFSLTNYIYTPF